MDVVTRDCIMGCNLVLRRVVTVHSARSGLLKNHPPLQKGKTGRQENDTLLCSKKSKAGLRQARIHSAKPSVTELSRTHSSLHPKSTQEAMSTSQGVCLRLECSQGDTVLALQKMADNGGKTGYQSRGYGVIAMSEGRLGCSRWRWPTWPEAERFSEEPVLG